MLGKSFYGGKVSAKPYWLYDKPNDMMSPQKGAFDCKSKILDVMARGDGGIVKSYRNIIIHFKEAMRCWLLIVISWHLLRLTVMPNFLLQS